MTDAPPRVLAVDPSLTGCGVCLLAGTATQHLSTVRPGTRRGHERLAYILSYIEDVRRTADVDLTVIEGPSYGSQGGQSGHHERAGLWWLIAHRLYEREWPYAVVAPTSRAQYATGNGRAGKTDVVAAMRERYPHVRICNDNEADALTLAVMGVDRLGGPVLASPERAHLAMRKVRWPNLPSDED